MRAGFKCYAIGLILESFIWTVSFAVKACEYYPVSGLREYYQCLDEEDCCENTNEQECCSKNEAEVTGLWYFWTGIFGSLSILVSAFLCGYFCNKKAAKKSKKQKVRPIEVHTVTNVENGHGDKNNSGTGPTFHAHPKPHVQTSRPAPQAAPPRNVPRGGQPVRTPLSGPGPALPGKRPLVPNPQTMANVQSGQSSGSSSLTPLDPAYMSRSAENSQIKPPPGFFQTKKSAQIKL